MSQRDCAVKLSTFVGPFNTTKEEEVGKGLQKSSSKHPRLLTSGAIQRYVPVSAVIISVRDSSLAKPKSASLTVLWSAVKIKFSGKGKLEVNKSIQNPLLCHSHTMKQ